MAFVKAGPSFPAMTMAEKPSLLSSFNRFRRFSVQFATMRRFLPARLFGPLPHRLASGGMVRKAGDVGCRAYAAGQSRGRRGWRRRCSRFRGAVDEKPAAKPVKKKG